MRPVPQRQNCARIGGSGTAVAEAWTSWDGVDLGKGCRVQSLGWCTVLLACTAWAYLVEVFWNWGEEPSSRAKKIEGGKVTGAE